MTKGFEQYRPQICQLYLEDGLPLEKVREIMKMSYNFDAQVRSYRYYLSKWDALRKDHPVRCSRTSYTTGSSAPSTLSSDSDLYPASSVTSVSAGNSLGAVQKRPVNLMQRPPDTAAVTRPTAPDAVSAGRGSILALRPSDLSVVVSHSLRLQPDNSPGSSPVQSFANPPRPLFTPPHASPSRCRSARDQPPDQMSGVRECHFCGATELHYLATSSQCLKKKDLMNRILAASGVNQGDIFGNDPGHFVHERTQVASCVNQCDIFGNNPGHFLASSGPTMSNIRAFNKAGTDLFRKNLAGETFLHLLDPSRLGGSLRILLQWFHERRPGILTQRTYHGKTVLHCLVEQSLFLNDEHGLEILRDILPKVFLYVKHDINARDNQGSTAMELFHKKWLTVKKPEERSCEEIWKFTYIFSTFVPDFGRDNLAGIRLSPTGRNSQDLSLETLELRDGEMRDLITEAGYNPLCQDYRGRNGLHCLASVVRLIPDIQQPLVSLKDTLVDLLERGVDVNAFDALGATPLHTFLSYPRSHAEDSAIALFIKLMVLRDRGAELNLRDRDGNCALHLACKSGRVPCVEILIALGADVNARNYLCCGAIAEARRELGSRSPEDAARIQQCIDIVQRAGGIDDPPQDGLQFYQNKECTELSLIETGSFLPRP